MTFPTFTRASRSALDQKIRILSLYKEAMRNVNNICKNYSVNYPPSVVRKSIRYLFDENAHLHGKELDVAILKGQMELREVLMIWKQPTHINRLVSRYLNAKKDAEKVPDGFLTKFIKGESI